MNDALDVVADNEYLIEEAREQRIRINKPQFLRFFNSNIKVSFMAQAGVIRDFMVALGFKTDNSGLKQMQDAMGGVENKANLLKGH
jgi:hypothetical protein